MTRPTDMQRGLGLWLYLGASRLIPLFAKSLLKRRLTRGKEHETRWVEKLGQSLPPRPDGTLIWINAVGLGEVMSLRGLILRMIAQNPKAQFLVTSTTAVSAGVFAQNMPPQTQHCFLPLDAPDYRRRFLDHMRPDLCVWAEQDIWPGFVHDLARRGIPQAMIAARMDAKAYARHRKLRGVFRHLYSAMGLITAQDRDTADHLTQLGAPAPVLVTGSLKPAAPALAADNDERAKLSAALADRKFWAVAPSHPDDEDIALQAQAQLSARDPACLLIIAPRFPDRRDALVEKIGPTAKLRSRSEVPTAEDSVWLFDTFGDMGLVYRLANFALIGGTFSDIEGHNPWEALILNTPIAHGPRTANFRTDFEALDQADAARQVTNADDICAILTAPDLDQMTVAAKALIANASVEVGQLAVQLLDMLEPQND